MFSFPSYMWTALRLPHGLAAPKMNFLMRGTWGGGVSCRRPEWGNSAVRRHVEFESVMLICREPIFSRERTHRGEHALEHIAPFA
jgi:hypothetical protein